MKKIKKPWSQFGPRRWAIFAVAVGIVVGTLLVMIWTGENGKAVAIRLPDQKGSKYDRCLIIASNFGHLDARVSVDHRTVTTPYPPPITFTSYKRVSIVDNGIPYTAIIAIQCLALFFLAPSVLSRRKRESPID